MGTELPIFFLKRVLYSSSKFAYPISLAVMAFSSAVGFSSIVLLIISFLICFL